MSSNSEIETKPQPKPKKKKENLKQRAYLNSVTSVLDYGSRLLTAFFVTPFLVSGLGSTLFGVWKVLGQFAGYTNLVDFKVTEVLKWAVAKDRDSVTDSQLKEYFAATFVLIMLLVPVLLIAGSVVVWYAPTITNVPAEYINIVRIATGLLIFSLIVNKVFSIFEAVLRGMNIGFKRMGIRAFIIVLGGGFQIAAMLLGYGIVALAIIQIIITTLIGVTVCVIVVREVDWLGWTKPNFERLTSFFKTSGWFMGWAGVKMVLSNSDKILLGYVAGPAIVTKYVITYYLMRSVQGLISNIIHGVIPGIGKLFGKGEFEKLIKVRSDGLLISWIMVVSLGTAILVINQSFTNIWIGEGEFAGQLVTLLILITILQYLFKKIDGSIILTSLEIKQKFYIGLLSALTLIITALYLIKDHGIVGLCVALVASNLVLNIGFPWILYVKTNRQHSLFSVPWRQIVITILLWSIAYFTGLKIYLESWFLLIFTGGLVSVMALCFTYFAGISKSQKENLIGYFKRVNFMKGDQNLG